MSLFQAAQVAKFKTPGFNLKTLTDTMSGARIGWEVALLLFNTGWSRLGSQHKVPA